MQQNNNPRNYKEFHNLTAYVQFQETTPPNTLVVVDYSATWCGPCKKFAPTYKQMAQRYPQVIFVHLMTDILVDKYSEDELPADLKDISAFPTFKLFLNQRLVNIFDPNSGSWNVCLKGANANALEYAIASTIQNYLEPYPELNQPAQNNFSHTFMDGNMPQPGSQSYAGNQNYPMPYDMPPQQPRNQDNTPLVSDNSDLGYVD